MYSEAVDNIHFSCFLDAARSLCANHAILWGSLLLKGVPKKLNLTLRSLYVISRRQTRTYYDQSSQFRTATFQFSSPTLSLLGIQIQNVLAKFTAKIRSIHIVNHRVDISDTPCACKVKKNTVV